MGLNHTTLALSLIMSFVLAFPLTAHADYKEAKTAFGKNDFAGAREACVKSDDPKCHNLLAALYVNGLGVKKDFTQAKLYWEKSIDGGFYKAYGNYSRQLLLGRGIKYDFDRGVQLADQAYVLGQKAGDVEFTKHLSQWMVKFHRGVEGGDASLVGLWQKRFQEAK